MGYHTGGRGMGMAGLDEYLHISSYLVILSFVFFFLLHLRLVSFTSVGLYASSRHHHQKRDMRCRASFSSR